MTLLHSGQIHIDIIIRVYIKVGSILWKSQGILTVHEKQNINSFLHSLGIPSISYL